MGILQNIGFLAELYLSNNLANIFRLIHSNPCIFNDKTEYYPYILNREKYFESICFKKIKVYFYKTDIQDLISYQIVANLQNMNLSYRLIGHYIIFLKSDQWGMGMDERMYLN